MKSKEVKAIFLEQIKDYIREKRIFLVIIIVGLIMAIIYGLGILQILMLTYLKPSNTIPFMISLTYYLLFCTIPFLVILLGHDAISGEYENGTLRGVISKISRNSFIIGKFMSVFTAISIVNFALLYGAAIYSFIKGFQIDILHTTLFFIYLTLYTAAITAVIIFFSSIFSKSSMSLSAIMLFNLILIYAGLNSDLSPINSFIPFKYIQNIVNLENLLTPVIIFLSYGVFFMAASMIIFRQRDL
jgi:ABC-type transport system involved in multi-copper enzyme maturation permease subunit